MPFHCCRNATISGSFDSTDSPLRGESVPLRMTAFFIQGLQPVCRPGLFKERFI
jgi:hypothetical protein